MRSTSVLGVPRDRVVLVDDKALPDSPSVVWDTELVGSHVLETLAQYHADMVRSLQCVTNYLPSLLGVHTLLVYTKHACSVGFTRVCTW